LLESKREGGTQFRDAITNADERIARSLLFPRLFGLTGEKFGSYALGSVQFEVVYSLLEELQNEVADELNKQLITRLLKLNFPEQDNSVKLVFLPPNREIVQNLINIYIELVKNGILEKDEADANKIKQLLRI
jgi:phage gp29-like protein